MYPNSSPGILKTNHISIDAKIISLYNNIGPLITKDDFKPSIEWDLSHLLNSIYNILVNQKKWRTK